MILRAFRAGSDRFGFRLVHYAIQNGHLHLLVEAKDSRALSRGVQGLSIRIARALNKLWGSKGKVFLKSYHAHILRTPREERNVLNYIFHNVRHHGVPNLQGLDYYSSGWWFDGWKEEVDASPAREIEKPVVEARTWLAREGWRRHGLISAGG